MPGGRRHSGADTAEGSRHRKWERTARVNGLATSPHTKTLAEKVSGRLTAACWQSATPMAWREASAPSFGIAGWQWSTAELPGRVDAVVIRCHLLCRLFPFLQQITYFSKQSFFGRRCWRSFSALLPLFF